jgi:hypothetical protein
MKIDFEETKPPHGTSFLGTDEAWAISASTRSWQAVVLVPFAILWNGMVWFGFYGQSIIHGNFSLLASILGLPFVLLGIILVSCALLTVCGHTIVKVAGNDGQVFLGVGRLGWTRKFDWKSVQAVSEYYSISGSHGYNRVSILLKGDQTRIQFGSLIGDERREYVIERLSMLLARRKTNSTSSL